MRIASDIMTANAISLNEINKLYSGEAGGRYCLKNTADVICRSLLSCLKILPAYLPKEVF